MNQNPISYAGYRPLGGARNKTRFSRAVYACAGTALALLFTAPPSLAAPWKKKTGASHRQIETREATPSLDPERTSETLAAQRARARDMSARLRQERAQTEDDDQHDDIDDNLEILAFVEQWASRTLQSNPTEKELLSANVQIGRILAAVKEPVVREKRRNLGKLFSNVVMGSVAGHAMPNLSPEQQNRPLGIAAAKKEPVFLYDPRQRSFHTAETLAAMTAEQVSRLDISPEHPAWYTESQFARMRSGRLKDFERWLQDGMNHALRADGDLEGREFWDIHAVRKVLFMEEVYKSATSAKATAEDAFGVEWKIKWGDEVQSEAVSSRLALLAGAKITDANFVVGPGPESMVLVLNKPGSYKEGEEPEEDEERSPETLVQLKKTLLDLYGLDISPYIHSHGVITAQNAHQLLRKHSGAGKKKYRVENVIGREWVSFRELLLELKPKGFIQRFDGSRMSDLAAINDRVARGDYLFSLWLSNRDVKDDNNKAYFIRQPSRAGTSMEIAEYREGHHDMGLTLGILFHSGNLNGMKVGSDFARLNADGSELRFPQAVIYKPQSWFAATWPDAKWMARKITSMTEAEIREAVASSLWPDFMQETLVYKLLARRNRIAELFNLTENLDRYPAPVPNFTVPLGSVAEIARAEKHYGLPAGSLREELAALGAGPNYTETVVLDGELTDCREGALVRAIARHRHPSGLDHRYDRTKDRHPHCIE